MQKKANILLISAFLLSFITIDNVVLAGGKPRAKAPKEQVGEKVDIDDVNLSAEEEEMLADKGQIKDLKSRIGLFNKYRKEIEENAKNCGDDLVDSTSMLSDIDRHISDLEAAELGELTQGEYFDLVRDSADLAKSIEKYYAEIEAIVERGQAKYKEVENKQSSKNSIDIKNTGKNSDDDDAYANDGDDEDGGSGEEDENEEDESAGEG